MIGSTDLQRSSPVLSGRQSGTAHPDESYRLALEFAPMVLNVIVRFPRDSYLSKSPALVTKTREGASDPVSEWFVSEHGFRDFTGRSDAVLELVVDKLES